MAPAAKLSSATSKAAATTTASTQSKARTLTPAAIPRAGTPTTLKASPRNKPIQTDLEDTGSSVQDSTGGPFNFNSTSGPFNFISTSEPFNFTNASRPFNFSEALRNILSKVAGMRTAGANVSIQASIIEALEVVIDKFDEHEQDREPDEVPSTENTMILDTLTQIQASVVNLEKRYNDIETKIMDTPKTYADIIKSASPELKDKKIKLRTLKRDQLEAIRKRRDQHSITLSIKATPATARQKIAKMPGIDIVERCQKAINAVMPSSQSHMIRGICKLSQAIKIQFDTEEHMELVRTYARTLGIDWNKAFNTTRIELREPRYGIVVHGVLVADLSTDDMMNAKIIKKLEDKNNMLTGTIVSITTLRRRTSKLRTINCNYITR